jgi:RimJ/RimL family protein N-acetyltransferase
MSGFSIRRSVPGDYDAGVGDLTERVASEGRWIGTEWPFDHAERRDRFMAQAERDGVASFVAIDGSGTIIGNLGIEVAPYGVADFGMMVADAWRGRGVGSALLAEAISWARQAGAHKIALQVWPHNQAAIGLYERFGFVREGLLVHHYRRRSGEVWDAVIMGLLLDRAHA